MNLTGKTLLFLLLYAPVEEGEPNRPVSGRTRLMKMVFLFEKEVLPEFERDRASDLVQLPEFFAWHFGPFSASLLDDLEFLVNQGYVITQSGADATPADLAEFGYWLEDLSDTPVNDYAEEVFSLTPSRGVEKGRQLWDELSPRQRSLLIAFKTNLVNASLDRILEYVYKKYAKHGYLDKSLIRERYLT